MIVCTLELQQETLKKPAEVDRETLVFQAGCLTAMSTDFFFKNPKPSAVQLLNYFVFLPCALAVRWQLAVVCS